MDEKGIRVDRTECLNLDKMHWLWWLLNHRCHKVLLQFLELRDRLAVLVQRLHIGEQPQEQQPVQQQVDSNNSGHASPHNVVDDTPHVHLEEVNENVRAEDTKWRHQRARRIHSEVGHVVRSDHSAECQSVAGRHCIRRWKKKVMRLRLHIDRGDKGGT